MFDAFAHRIARRLGLKTDVFSRLLNVKAVYLPMWSLTLSAVSEALAKGIRAPFEVTIPFGTSPGTDLAPLNELAFRPDNELQSVALGSAKLPHPPPDKDLPPTRAVRIPFTLAPTNLLRRIRAVPTSASTIESAEPDDDQTGGKEPLVRLNLESTTFPLAAAYPIYLPLYLGEYERQADPSDRVTVVLAGWGDPAPAVSTAPICSPAGRNLMAPATSSQPSRVMTWRSWTKEWHNDWQGELTDATITTFFAGSFRPSNPSDAKKLAFVPEADAAITAMIMDAFMKRQHLEPGTKKETAARAAAAPEIMRRRHLGENATHVTNRKEVEDLRE